MGSNPVTNNQKLLAQLRELKGRIQRLEVDNDMTARQLGILSELVEIFREIPNGQQIYNRALNRYRLNYLHQIVLPRRQQQLIEIETDKSMPKGARSTFISKELRLIKSATRAIRHRQFFESNASTNVKSMLNHIFSSIQRHSARLQLPQHT